MDLSSVIPYADAAPQLEETVSHVNITEDDPAIIMNWNLEASQEVVARAIVIDGAPDKTRMVQDLSSNYSFANGIYCDTI